MSRTAQLELKASLAKKKDGVAGKAKAKPKKGGKGKKTVKEGKSNKSSASKEAIGLIAKLPIELC